MNTHIKTNIYANIQVYLVDLVVKEILKSTSRPLNAIPEIRRPLAGQNTEIWCVSVCVEDARDSLLCDMTDSNMRNVSFCPTQSFPT